MIIVFVSLLLLTFNNGILNFFLTGLADEVLLLLSILVIISNTVLTLKVSKLSLAFYLYICTQVVNYYFSPFNIDFLLVFIQAFINVKVFIVSWAFLLVWTQSNFNIKVIRAVYFAFIFLFLVGLIANFILQESWNEIILQGEAIGYRYGFLRPIGWFGSTPQNGYFFVITSFTLLLIYGKKQFIDNSFLVKKLFIFILIDFMAAFPLTVRKGVMMFFPFSWVVFSRLNAGKKVFFIGSLLIFLSTFIFLIKDMNIAKDTVENLSLMMSPEGSTYIRGFMVHYGWSLFYEFFPLGVGGATFGTVLSQYNTLDVYSYVGLDLNWIYYGNGERLWGVFDSGFFSMLAENGFIGMLFMFIFIYYFFKLNKNNLDEYGYLVFKVITLLTILLSLTEPVWQNGMFTAIYTINVFFIYTKNNMIRKGGKWVRV